MALRGLASGTVNGPAGIDNVDGRAAVDGPAAIDGPTGVDDNNS